MKKLLLVLFGISGLFLASKPLKVNASVEESVVVSEVSSEVVEETSEQVSEVEETSEYTLEEFKAEVQSWLSDYVETSLLQRIITWLVDSFILGSLFAVYVKYRKHKAMTLEDVAKLSVNAVKDQLKTQFGELSKEEIKKITSKVAELERSVETVMKVLVLMQDNTPKGKTALIEYLGSKTTSEEVKQATQQVNDAIKVEEEAKKEVNEKVSGKYEDIF